MTNAFYRTTLASATAVLLAGCSKPTPVSIPFVLSFQDQVVDCDQFPQSGRNAAQSIKLKDFRFYLHDIQLQNDEGQWQAINLTGQSRWQNDSTVLLDFENAKADCTSGNTATNTMLKGEVAPDIYQGIRFKIGVPFNLNHQNPLTAKTPLNESSMHWHWQGGYKFVRAEFIINNIPRRLHIGSLQCKGEINAITHCEKPNRAEIVLKNFTLDESTVVIKLDQLIDHNQIDNTSNITCMGNNQYRWCANALQWIGLDPAVQQTAFGIVKGAL